MCQFNVKNLVRCIFSTTHLRYHCLDDDSSCSGSDGSECSDTTIASAGCDVSTDSDSSCSDSTDSDSSTTDSEGNLSSVPLTVKRFDKPSRRKANHVRMFVHFSLFKYS